MKGIIGSEKCEGVPPMLRELGSVLKLEITYDGGIKVKNGTWTAPMSYPECFAMLMKMARERGVKLPKSVRAVS
jgi:hypothetical protein